MFAITMEGEEQQYRYLIALEDVTASEKTTVRNARALKATCQSGRISKVMFQTLKRNLSLEGL